MDETRLTRLKGNTHPLARAEFDRGVAPNSLPMERMLLVLKRSPEQEAALKRLMDGQLDKFSPSYHKWLTPEQFGHDFGPSDEDIQAIASWLASHGFQVVRVSKGRTMIEFSGTAGQVQQTFGTSIHKYVVNGEEHWANANDPLIPSALTPVVVGIDSLHNFPKKPMVTFPTPCGASGLQSGGSCFGLGPYDFATIYNVLPLWNAGIDGTGQTIAIVAASNINIQDVRDFRNLFGLPAKDPMIIVNGPDPGIIQNQNGNRLETEADSDVEWAGAVARGATIDLVVSKSTNTTFGADLSAEYIVDHNLAPILSGSYSFCELVLGTAGNQFHNTLWQQAAAQGITVFIGTGDNGSANCDNFAGAPPAQKGLTVSGIASTPYNVAVGGTDLNDFTSSLVYWNSTNDPTTHASARGYIPETTWNDSCTNATIGMLLGFGTDAEANCNNPQLSKYVQTAGGSGGKSNCTVSDGQNLSSCSGGYPKPSWQAGKGVPNDGGRDLPDVSLFAGSNLSGSFYLVCQSDANSGGVPCDLNIPSAHISGAVGTSLSGPAFAGIMALVGQKMGSPQGNANPVFYALAAQQSAANCNSASPANTCLFNDVTLGTIAMPCKRGTPDCNVGNAADSIGLLRGYDAGAGYDLATGLGSVNAFNLVNASGWTNTSTAPDFTLSSTNPRVAVSSPGGSGTMILTVTSINGFGGTFNLTAGSCSAMPTGASCNFSPGFVTVSQATPTAAVTLTVITTAPSMSIPVRLPINRDRPTTTEVIALSGCALYFSLLLRFRIN